MCACPTKATGVGEYYECYKVVFFSSNLYLIRQTREKLKYFPKTTAILPNWYYNFYFGVQTSQCHWMDGGEDDGVNRDRCRLDLNLQWENRNCRSQSEWKEVDWTSRKYVYIEETGGKFKPTRQVQYIWWISNFFWFHFYVVS